MVSYNKRDFSRKTDKEDNQRCQLAVLGCVVLYNDEKGGMKDAGERRRHRN